MRFPRHLSSLPAGIVRRLIREPGFAAVFVVTLALGVGANAALLTALRGYYLAPLPYHDSSRLVNIEQRLLGASGMSTAAYRDVLANIPQIASGGMVNESDTTIRVGDHPRVVMAAQITPSLLPTLGVNPQLGRGISPAAGRAGGPHQVMLSHGFWQSAFGGNGDVVGKTLEIDGSAYTIVGVTPAGFYFPDRSPQIYVPMVLDHKGNGFHELLSFSSWYFVARLKPGVTFAQLQTALQARADNQIAGFQPKERKFAKQYHYTLRATPLRASLIRDTGKHLALIELGAAFLLALAIAILANLVTVRVIGRRHEQALRLALGADRWTLWRAALSDTLPLALVGGTLAILIAWLGTDLLSRYGFGADDSVFAVGIGPWTAAMAFVLALVAGIFAAAPAALGSGAQLLARLTEGGYGTPSRAARLAQRSLSVLQVALGVTLLVNAGLISLSFHRLSTRSLGFGAPRLVVASLGLRGPQFSGNTAQIAFAQQFAQAAGKLPGVIRAGIATRIPFGQESSSYNVGRPGSGENKKAFPSVSSVTAGLLPTLDVKLVAGRLFSADEISGAAPVAVVGEPLAKAVYGSARAALGQPLVGNKQTVRIIGVTRPVRWFAHPPGRFDGTLWLPYSKLGGIILGNVFVAVRSSLPTPVVARQLDGLLARLAPTQAFSWVRSMDKMTAQAYRGDQAPAALFMIFALIALLLAAVGVYGTIAYLTRLRLAEFAVRQSLGASPARVHAEAVGQGVRIALVGAVLGLAGGALLARALAGFTEVPAAQSVPIYAVAAIVLVAVAVASAAVAARRARRTDLVTLLRPQ